MTDFKIKMATLAKKYNISHKRDIDWHNFVAEVEELTHPELAESEDERIRLFICDFITHIAWRKDWDISKEDCLAYLEKQKDLDKMIVVSSEVWDKAINDAYENGEKEGKKQKENPKSADSIPSDCTSDVKYEDRWHKVANSLPDNGRDVLAKDALGNFLLASFDGDRWYISGYDNEDKPIVYTPAIEEWCDIPSEKQKEPKPAEWSEEDEKKINFLSRLIEFQVKDDEYCFGDGRLISKQEAIEMLKSLRPVSKESLQSWKPSEEQMEAFKSYIEDSQSKAEAAVGGWDNFDVMIHLYEQLKKL